MVNVVARARFQPLVVKKLTTFGGDYEIIGRVFAKIINDSFHQKNLTTFKKWLEIQPLER